MFPSFMLFCIYFVTFVCFFYYCYNYPIIPVIPIIHVISNNNNSSVWQWVVLITWNSVCKYLSRTNFISLLRIVLVGYPFRVCYVYRCRIDIIKNLTYLVAFSRNQTTVVMLDVGDLAENWLLLPELNRLVWLQRRQDSQLWAHLKPFFVVTYGSHFLKKFDQWLDFLRQI